MRSETYVVFLGPVRNVVSRAVVAAAVVFPTGCAFIDQQVPLAYSPRTLDEQPMTVPFGEGRVACVTRPMDQRPEQTRLGPVRNLYGMKTANVRPSGDVPLWIQDAIAAELEQAGFKVVRDNCDASLVDYEVSSTVLKTVGDAYFRVSVEVALALGVARGKQPLLPQRVYTGEASGGNWSYALSLALEKALVRFIADLRTTGDAVVQSRANDSQLPLSSPSRPE
ncbi:MAG: hypothetical protein KDD69_13185 [Bdellovibrionales bacterium]|nr:hypothetical protein [Bdellovibrionales bacterium]